MQWQACRGETCRDWGSRSQFQDGSVAVSSTGLVDHALASRSIVSASSCSSYQGGPVLYQPDGSSTDLRMFSDAVAGKLQLVEASLSQTDHDLLAAATVSQIFFAELVDSAQRVAGNLSMTATQALEKLPALLWARSADAQLVACVVELHDSIALLFEGAKSVRADYIDFLKYMQYLGQCVQITVDQLVMSSLPEPVEDEGGSLECQAPLELSDTDKELQKLLELALMHLDGICRVLEECSDFWLMLHEAELQLRKLEKESTSLSHALRTHAPGLNAASQKFCEHVKSFFGVYSGLAPPTSKSQLPEFKRSCS
ncbi:mettl14 [Symbiodinium natans]|uniref:Mettl14 protein n=1 Tax=Symbiodinium natans TaxID=878477 RepID=A0A812IA46_9DINO|nr:mettl14 [Symbiodinium natans]